MAEKTFPIVDLLREDPRYKLEAYQFVREALQYAQEVLEMPPQSTGGTPAGKVEHHLTGQQLCEAIRVFALEQYGYLAKLVLNSWGIYSTGDFGEIVYNLIELKRCGRVSTIDAKISTISSISPPPLNHGFNLLRVRDPSIFECREPFKKFSLGCSSSLGSCSRSTLHGSPFESADPFK